MHILNNLDKEILISFYSQTTIPPPNSDQTKGRGGATLSLGGAVAPAKKKIYPLECVRKLIGPPYVGHLAPPYLTILLVKSHQF